MLKRLMSARLRLGGVACLLAAGAFAFQARAQPATPAPGAAPLTIARQGSFFVGGRDVAADTLSTLPAYAASGTITVDQMYVRYQVPVDPGAHPRSRSSTAAA